MTLKYPPSTKAIRLSFVVVTFMLAITVFLSFAGCTISVIKSNVQL